MLIRTFQTTIVAMLAVLACGMLLTALVVAIIGDWMGATVLTLSASPALVAFLLRRKYEHDSGSHNLAVNSAAVAIGWFISSLFAAVPIWAIAVLTTANDATTNETMMAHRSFLNAWYDGTSSITSAGLTSTLRSSELTLAIQLWRSVAQWIGGVGMAVMAVSLIADDRQAWMLYQGETRQWSSENIDLILRRVCVCYLGLTVICASLFGLTGMPAWQAFNHSLIVVSTGGLTVIDESFTNYSIAIQAIACVFMLLGATSFSAIYLGISGRWRYLIRRTDLRGSLAVMSVAVVIASGLNLMAGRGPTWDQTFNLISAMTTCGIRSGSLDAMIEPMLLFLVAVMLIGGCSDSTAGGLKLNRLLWLGKVVQTEGYRGLRSDCANARARWNDQAVDEASFDASTRHCAAIGVLFLVTYAVAVMLLRLAYGDRVGLMQISFQAASAQSTVGLSMDLIGPNRPASAKVIEIGLMIIGRLEIMAVLLIPFVFTGPAKSPEESPKTNDGVV